MRLLLIAWYIPFLPRTLWAQANDVSWFNHSDRRNKEINSGSTVDSLVEWHLVGEDQACLVPVEDWPMRALIRARHRPYHDSTIIENEPAAVEEILAALDARGPLSSLEFETKTGYGTGSWSGSTQAKRILRSLWASGEIVTHHRRVGRHYYDRAERVIPALHFGQPSLNEEATYYRWIIAHRFQAAGLLRPTAEAAIWSACGEAATRKLALAELVESGTITPVEIGENKLRYYVWTQALTALAEPPLEPRVLFLGPLDSFLWDRKSIQQIFGFDYIWEVYKPEQLRKWGYYVLPVFYGERFVARLDSRLEKGIWNIINWWWEDDVVPDAPLLEALSAAMARFLTYLGVERIQASESVDASVRGVIARLA